MIKGDELFKFAFVLFILIVFSIFFLFLMDSAIKYYELKEVIKECNQNFGIGNWTFMETKERYSCNMQVAYQYKTTTITSSTECSINGIKVNCEDIRK